MVSFGTTFIPSVLTHPLFLSLSFSPLFSFLSLRSSSSKLAQLTLEQILEHMDNLRLNLINNKHNCEP